MATPIDGPGLFPLAATWRSKFGFALWTKFGGESIAEATTTENTLLFTGGVNYVFGFNGGYDSASQITLDYGLGFNERYVDEFVGKNFIPGGQDQPPSPPDGAGRYAIPCPPQAMTSDLFTTGVQTVPSAEYPAYWYSNTDGVEGLVDQT